MLRNHGRQEEDQPGGAEVTVLTDDECNYLWVGLTDRPSFVREVEEAVLSKVVEIAREYIYYDSDYELFVKRIREVGSK